MSSIPQTLGRKLAAASFLLRSGVPPRVLWRLAHDLRRASRPSERSRSAQQRLAESLHDARFTQTWFLRNVPTWLSILEVRDLLGRTGLRILEIGSWEGLSCRFVLEHLPGSVVTCVDTWAGADEHVTQSGTKAAELAELEARFDHNTRGYGDRVRKWKGKSQQYFAACEPRECFDLVYVDGSHRADDVLLDAIHGFAALAPGGVMIFDDYLWKYYDEPRDNPGAGINAFLRLKRGRYDLLHAAWQVAIAKSRRATP